MLPDTENQLIMIPENKIVKAIEQITAILNNKKRKATVHQVQKLCGLLNFICRAIIPGRPFLMRLYSSLRGIKAKRLKPYHHVRLALDTVIDLEIWQTFLSSPESYSRPFLDMSSVVNALNLDWFMDSVKGKGRGFGGHHDNEWFWGTWSTTYIDEKDPSIEYLELYVVLVGVMLWLHKYKNMRVVLYCNNESVVYMVNKQTSKCKKCMVLIRLLALQCMVHNTRVYARYVKTKLNGRADALSRGRLDTFFTLSKKAHQTTNKYPERIPSILKDVAALWLD